MNWRTLFTPQPTASEAGRALSLSKSERWKVRKVAREMRESMNMPPHKGLGR